MFYEMEGLRPKIAESAFVFPTATIIGNVTIGEECYVGPGAILRCESKINGIIMDDYSVVEDGVLVHVDARVGQCYIGKHATVGHGAIVHCKHLGNYASVGMGAILSLFSEIGEYSVVAEGAVVKKFQIIPPRVVVGGAPAKILRKLEDRDIASWKYANGFYVELGARCRAPGALRAVSREECK